MLVGPAALGVGPGDAVITAPMTFCSTVHVIEHQGARPVFIDSERTSWNLDPALVVETIERKARQGKLPKAAGDHRHAHRARQRDPRHRAHLRRGRRAGAHTCTCTNRRCSAGVIPGIYELLDGSVSVKQVRDVRIEDLLRRAPVQTDTAAVAELLAGKRVLVTGGGGSISAELCRQILRCDPARLIVLGHGKNSIFEIVEELKAPAAARGVQLMSRWIA